MCDDSISDELLLCAILTENNYITHFNKVYKSNFLYKTIVSMHK